MSRRSLGGETLVEWAYFIGGTYFLLGAYCHFFEVINVGRAGGRVLFAGPLSGPSESGYWGSLLYLIGAALFEVAVVSAVVGLRSPHAALQFEWVPLACPVCAQRGRLILSRLGDGLGCVCVGGEPGRIRGYEDT